MKFSKQLLKHWVEFNLPSETLLEKLTLAGFEVENVQATFPPFSGVKIGSVLACEPHPHADRLRIATVDIGLKETLSIICGAPNCRSGIKVACAVEGARLPELLIKKRELRGILSEGMLCSSNELGLLAEQEEGILELPAEAPLGAELHEYWNLVEDEWLHINVMPNRGDCLSHYGMARELSSILNLPCRSLTEDQKLVEFSTATPVAITLTEEAKSNVRQLQTIALRIENPKAMTPPWMQQTLRCAGINVLPHPILNILNYVMLELGQPLHAYNAAQVGSQLMFRTARAHETVQLLNQATVQLPESALLVTNEHDILCLAGIMGTSVAAIQNADTDLLIEAAQFDATCIAKSARELHLNTEASYRFERGVSAELAPLALARVASLATTICGGKAYRGETYTTKPANLPSIELHQKVLDSRIGIAFSSESVRTYLHRIFCQVEDTSVGWRVFPPVHRSDLRLPEDLIEEILRLHGYHNLPTSLPKIRLQCPPNRTLQSPPMNRLKERLFARGYQEVINYSFIPHALASLFGEEADLITLINPISREMDTLRPSLLPSLLQTAEHNLKRQETQLQCFEIGRSFCRDSSTVFGIKETSLLGFLALGKRYSIHWQTPDSTAEHSFFSMKALLEELLTLCHVNPSILYIKRSTYSYLHPYQQAHLFCSMNNLLLGKIGQLHPKIARKLNYTYPIFYGELNLETVPYCHVEKCDSSYSRFPFIQHNLSFILREEIASSEVIAKCKEIGGPMLKQITVFDRYMGSEVETGFLALGVTFIWQAPDKTLKEEDVHYQERKIITALAQMFGATLRGYET